MLPSKIKAEAKFTTGGGVSLSARELAFCVAASSAGFVAVELEKLVTRRGWLRRGV